MSTTLKNIPIVHLNTAKTWRGGEKQTFYLTRELNRMGFKSVCVCQRDSILEKRLRESGLPFHPLKMRSEFDIFSAWKIALIAGGQNAGILHMHTSHAHSLGLLSNLFYKTQVNMVSRRVDFRIKRHLLNRVKYSFPDKYIAVSNAVREILIEGGIPADKTAAVHSGVDPDDYKSVESDYLFSEFSAVPDLTNKIKLVNTAALTPQKDHETLIRAMEIIVKKRGDVVLFIVGEGELAVQLKKLSSSLRLDGHVIFTGFREDALQFIKFGDIFTLSSRWEGLGTSIIDAMALGKPAVACRTGGTPELVRDGVEGLLVERENPAEFARAVLRLMDDIDLRRRFSEAAPSRAADFSIEKTTGRTIEIYEECLREKIVK